jgi:N-acetylmuramic acid 6-phosphate etherase/N-acetylglucosamine-6-phosphate deacetylase
VDTNDLEFLEHLGTEQVRPELSDLDELSVHDLVDLMCADVRQLPHTLAAAQPQIVDAVTDVVARMARGGRLIYVGAGTAGRLGMLDAAEAGPTFNTDEGQVIGVLAGGFDAFGVPKENAEDDFEGGQDAIRALNVSERDCVVGISASGRTPYVLGAIESAISLGALTVGIANNFNTPLAQNVDRPIEVVVGPELIAGSTRMNSGTAQKIVLNVLSTATMVRLGKTYGNLMVDLRPTNEKLRDRSARIVARITDATLEEAHSALEASGWKTKVAAAMIVGHVDAGEAAQRLTLYEGQLRPTLESLRTTSSGDAKGRTTSKGWTRLGVAAAFVNGALVEGDIAVRDGVLVAVGLSSPGHGTAVAGLIDAQVNGSYGVDLLHADVDEILEMSNALLRDGVIAFQPTLITSDFAQLSLAREQLREARQRQREGAMILNSHLEGPFLSPLRSGTHPVEYLRAPDMELLEQLLEGDDVAMVTIAPELPGALALIERCVRHGIVVSLGHSAASAAEAAAGFVAGASAVTHLFNAMEPLSARAPGLAGSALARDGVSVQLIGDHVHVADEMMKMAFRTAAGRCLIVSDAIAAAGVDDTTVQLGDVTVTIVDGVARRNDGTIAGSIAKLRDGLARLGSLGIAHDTAIAAAVSRPAHLLGVAHLATLTPGTPANFFIVNDHLEIEQRVTPSGVLDVA